MNHVALLAVLLLFLGMALGALFILLLFGRFVVPVVRLGSPVKVSSMEGTFEITALSANTSSYTADDSVSLELHRKRTR